ncbi:hypothetical protein RIR_jg17334.t1 [Rhizophagus irregularis DAOM 181602=DAOM 197198]|nr:hypothetical protein RIR_jg17334.t1 [Rhizophagus irregularis DAOM 181602=DAOM 197198]
MQLQYQMVMALIFLRNEPDLELDEVYKPSKYDGGSSRGGKLTLPPAQHIAKDRKVWLPLWFLSSIQNLAPQ